MSKEYKRPIEFESHKASAILSDASRWCHFATALDNQGDYCNTDSPKLAKVCPVAAIRLAARNRLGHMEGSVEAEKDLLKFDAVTAGGRGMWANAKGRTRVDVLEALVKAGL
jgi:hypothetical protein